MKYFGRILLATIYFVYKCYRIYCGFSCCHLQYIFVSCHLGTQQKLHTLMCYTSSIPIFPEHIDVFDYHSSQWIDGSKFVQPRITLICIKILICIKRNTSRCFSWGMEIKCISEINHWVGSLPWFDISQIKPYSSGLHHWHWCNHAIIPASLNQPSIIWVTAHLHDVITLRSVNTTKTKQNPTKPLTYFIGYVDVWSLPQYNERPSFRLMGSHHKVKRVVRPFYLYNGNPYTGKRVSLYLDGPLVARSGTQVLKKTDPLASTAIPQSHYTG